MNLEQPDKNWTLVDADGKPLPQHDVWSTRNGLYVPQSTQRFISAFDAWMMPYHQPRPEPEPEPVPAVEERTEVVEGWRDYSLDLDAGELLLRGMYGQPWKGRYMQAECNMDGVVADHLKDDTCSCGIYGNGQLDDCNNSSVIARVRAWGVVQVDEDGNFRASEVEMAELYVLQEMDFENNGWLNKFVDWGRIADLLRDRYAVPVHLVDSIQEIEEKQVST